MQTVGLLVHVPHASLYIPPEYRDGYLLPPDELEHETAWSADIYCDELFAIDKGMGLIARQSRLVCDVERFKDDSLEPMAQKGNGLYYTHTLRGKLLRNENPALKTKIINEIYGPHHVKLTETVDDILSRYDICLIIDGHSFGDDLMHGENLPDFCIGTDKFHTPGFLEKTATDFFNSNGFSVETNRPFAGAITPFKHYQKEKRLWSIMIEVNKRLYVQEDRVTKLVQFPAIKKICADAITLLWQKSGHG
jgi:N-formylglutamate amidohydrolase